MRAVFNFSWFAWRGCFAVLHWVDAWFQRCCHQHRGVIVTPTMEIISTHFKLVWCLRFQFCFSSIFNAHGRHKRQSTIVHDIFNSRNGNRDSFPYHKTSCGCQKRFAFCLRNRMPSTVKTRTTVVDGKVAATVSMCGGQTIIITKVCSNTCFIHFIPLKQQHHFHFLRYTSHLGATNAKNSFWYKDRMSYINSKNISLSIRLCSCPNRTIWANAISLCPVCFVSIGKYTIIFSHSTKHFSDGKNCIVRHLVVPLFEYKSSWIFFPFVCALSLSLSVC